jgi:tetratricopeptide (TPR) repeat protein
MTIRSPLAVFTAGLGLTLALALPAQADAVRLRDGTWLPKSLTGKVPAGQEPDDTQLEDTRAQKISVLGSDVVKIGSTEVSAGLVDLVIVLELRENPDFQQGMTEGSSGFFDEAAAAFERAAGTLKGVPRQVALNQRAVAVAQLNDVDALLPAIDQLVAEFPKSHYLPDLLTRKARGLLAKGDAAGAKAALDALTASPGLNKRDLYTAELAKVQLFMAGTAGKDKAKLAEAENAFRALQQRMETDAAREEVASVRLRALVGIGRMLVFQGDLVKAKPYLQQVIDAPGSEGDPGMLAAAYTGMGHVMFAEASAKQASAGADQAARKVALELLETAVLHYLRVTELYGERAERSDLYDARVSAARVFGAMFLLSNDADCEAGRSAYRYYGDAYRMLGAGAERNQVGKDATELKARLDKACAAPKPAAPPTPAPAK